MANVDELCQFARLGQLCKIQKYLQTHSMDDINSLNLYGESVLSTATYYNQNMIVEYLLDNKADPTLRLAAGHTAVHIACRSANLSILKLLLSIKKDKYDNEDEQQQREDKHIYDCLRVADNLNLTPIHWAATQESVSKRQKVFAYLDRRMPGVLDSRYNIDWFNAWAKTHPWVLDERITKTPLTNTQIPKLTNTDKIHRPHGEQRVSLPVMINGHSPVVMTPRTSLHDYEPTPTTTRAYYYDGHIEEQRKRTSAKVEHAAQMFNLPPTPITSRNIGFIDEHRTKAPKQSPINNKTTDSQKTPYLQRLTSIIKHSISSSSDYSTYRAQRAHVIPTFNYLLSPTIIEHKRPAHNLLSNILPSTSTSSSSLISDQDSQQSTKSFICDASVGFRHHRRHHDTTTSPTMKTHTQSLFENEVENYGSNQFDYLCKSTSSLALSSPGTYSYDI